MFKPYCMCARSSLCCGCQQGIYLYRSWVQDKCGGVQGCFCVIAASEVIAFARGGSASGCVVCRVVRGLLLAVGRPDGRVCSHAKTEAWVVLGLQQVCPPVTVY